MNRAARSAALFPATERTNAYVANTLAAPSNPKGKCQTDSVIARFKKEQKLTNIHATAALRGP